MFNVNTIKLIAYITWDSGYPKALTAVANLSPRTFSLPFVSICKTKSNAVLTIIATFFIRQGLEDLKTSAHVKLKIALRLALMKALSRNKKLPSVAKSVRWNYLESSQIVRFAGLTWWTSTRDGGGGGLSVVIVVRSMVEAKTINKWIAQL